MTVTLLKGDCLDLLPTIEANSIDSCVTDPPYGISFMGKNWDHGVPGRAFWEAVYRVLKPGAHLVAFGGTRTYHRLACAIEDAGFEPRDMLAWLYGCGFPKNSDTALKPALEPVAFMRKPLSEDTVAANMLRWNTGALNIAGCRIEARARPLREKNFGGADVQGKKVFGTGLSPTSKAIGTTDNGRWPANVITDGSDEVVGAFPDTGKSHHSGVVKRGGNRFGGTKGDDRSVAAPCDSGSAARYFYSAKASKQDRAGSKHPTVKPISLMQWLARLITPPGGTVLDPFAGSGTTGAACEREGFDCILIEREPEYQVDIERRLFQAAQPQLALA